MNCAFCETAGEILECGHVVCEACLRVLGALDGCPVSQLCGGQLLTLRAECRDNELVIVRPSEPKALNYARKDLEDWTRLREQFSAIVDALIARQRGEDRLAALF